MTTVSDHYDVVPIKQEEEEEEEEDVVDERFRVWCARERNTRERVVVSVHPSWSKKGNYFHRNPDGEE